MAKEISLHEALEALLRTSSSLLREADLLQPLLYYLQSQAIKNPCELCMDQRLVTEAMSLSRESNDGWLGWMQMDHCLRVKDGHGENHVLHWEQTIPLRVPPR